MQKNDVSQLVQGQAPFCSYQTKQDQELHKKEPKQGGNRSRGEIKYQLKTRILELYTTYKATLTNITKLFLAKIQNTLVHFNIFSTCFINYII